MVAVSQDARPPTRSRIPDTGAVRNQLDLFERPLWGGGSSGWNKLQLSFEEGIHLFQYLRGLSGLVDVDSQLRSVAHAVSEVSGELFHLTNGVRRVALGQHRVVSSHDLVPITLGRLL